MLKYRSNITCEISLTNSYLFFPFVSKIKGGNSGPKQYFNSYFTKHFKHIMINKYSVKICLSFDLISFFLHHSIIHEHWSAKDLEEPYFVSVLFTKEHH